MRAAGGRVVISRRQRRAARLVEVPPQQRAPVIRAYLRRRGRRVGSKAMASEARNYFGVSADASLEEIQGVVEHYPVFRIDYQGHASTGRGWGSDSPRPNAQERASRAGHKLKAPRLDAAGLLKNFARSSDVITAHRGDRLQCRGNE